MSATKVIARISPACPWGIEPESAVERAAQNCHNAHGDFQIAIRTATTAGEALRLHEMLHELVMAFLAAEDSALNRADALIKEM